MMFDLYVYREKGQRLLNPIRLGGPVEINSQRTGAFLQLNAVGEILQGEPNPSLFDARIVRMSKDEMLLLGFEQVGGQAVVQEWGLKPAVEKGNWDSYAQAKGKINRLYPA